MRHEEEQGTIIIRKLFYKFKAILEMSFTRTKCDKNVISI